MSGLIRPDELEAQIDEIQPLAPVAMKVHIGYGDSARTLREMVKKLDPREATILRYRFGLDGGSEKTLEEVGEKFGVTRERVRQIQNIALKKLRKMIEKLEAQKK